jgi:hypothetical protein
VNAINDSICRHVPQAQGVDTGALWSRIADMVIKTVLSGEHDIIIRARKNLRSKCVLGGVGATGPCILLSRNMFNKVEGVIGGIESASWSSTHLSTVDYFLS